MIELTEKIMLDFKKAKPYSFATCSLTGEPNVAAMGMVKIVDPGTIWIMDNYMKKTYSNIKENPRGSILVHSAETEGSYQIKGDLEILNYGPLYDEAKKWANEKNPDLPARNLIVFHVTDVYDARWGPNAGNRINML